MRFKLNPAVLLVVAVVVGHPLVGAGKSAPTPQLRAEMIGMRPAIYADERGHLHMAYEGYEFRSRATDIIYVGSGDLGASWTGYRNLSRSSGVSKTPAIATDAETGVDVIWCDTPPGQRSPDIYFTRSDNGGGRWGGRVDISNTPGPSGRPALAVAPDRSIHVVWEDTALGTTSPDIWYACSTDNGRTWSRAKNISNASGRSREPSIEASADGSVHVVWSDSSMTSHPVILYARTSDHGQSWTQPKEISNTPDGSVHPDIACGDAEHVYVAWAGETSDGRTSDVFYSASRDGGNSFGAARNVSNSSGASLPRIAAQHGRVAVAWSQQKAGPWVLPNGLAASNVWIATSSNEGEAFNAPHDLSKGNGLALSPDVAIAKGTAVVVWESVEHGVSHIKTASEAIR